MDVKTGQILSMANLVATHPAALGATRDHAARPIPAASCRSGRKDAVDEAQSNLAVTQLYEPGSVFKLVTFSAASAGRPDQPQLRVHRARPDQPGRVDLPRRRAAPDRAADRHADPGAVLQHRDLGLIAQGVGEQRLLNQVKALGFGQSTGLDFPGESPGLLATAAQWEPTDYVSLPIGQVDAVSALQVLDAYNAVANGGVYVAPKLVQATVSPSGALTKTAPSATHQVFSPSVDSELSTMLQQVVNQGTGTSAAVPGLHRGRQDGHRPDPHHRPRLLRHRAPTWPPSSGSPPPPTRPCP